MGVFSVHQNLNFSLCHIKALAQQIPSALFCFQLHYAQTGLNALDSPVGFQVREKMAKFRTWNQ